jgi:hypothetical protein
VDYQAQIPKLHEQEELLPGSFRKPLQGNMRDWSKSTGYAQVGLPAQNSQVQVVHRQ